ncbi:MAG: dipeptidase [Acidobacteria bacterium]|nr:dipeptidase [Acidobacteriota bacterium]
MQRPLSRRRFLSHSGSVLGGSILGAMLPRAGFGARRPGDYIIVEGHRDIWELSDRFRLPDKSQHSPVRDFLVPRLVEAGVSVVIMPAGGDSLEERDGRDNLFEGSMRVLDMLLCEIEKTGGRASIIRSRADIPERPNSGKVQFFLDLEGGGSVQIDPEPGYHSDRRLALLRQFFRLGVRGMQLTHNGRNMLADGVGGGKMGGRLSEFGVEVIHEMNRLGMMVGVSHLSANGILHAAEVTKQPIVSTHQNVQPFLKTPLELTEPEVRAIASTGGIIGLRYIEDVTPYKLLVDEVEYLAKSVGIEHIGIGWLGHDKGHPAVGHVPGYSQRQFSGVEAQSMYEHWDTFIRLLGERGFTEEQIGLVLGGNLIRIWKQILPAAAA